MDELEQENQELRDTVSSMQAEIERLTSMMSGILAAQAQVSAPQVTTTAVTMPVSVTITSAPQVFIPEGGFSWGIPQPTVGERFYPIFSGTQTLFPQQTTSMPQHVFSAPQAIMTQTLPFVHAFQQETGPVFHTQSEVGNDRVDDLQDKYNEIQLEMKALRGKELFGQSAHELCLVPNVVIPHKFKIPDFEKYRGSTCPKAHLIMYARKMSSYTGNDKFLIHCFQESLTGAALRWYMDLDGTRIRTFNDLANAFIQQYNYNSYLAPDRDELRALSQKEKESFKEYAQRWRELAAQIKPPLEEKELTKLFLNTLSPFYYEKMLAGALSNFTDMVGMGVRIEEAVREGRLTKGDAPIAGIKKVGHSFAKKKDQEVSMVAHSKPKPGYQYYPYVAAIPQNSPYQLQSQRPPPYYPAYPQQLPYPPQTQIRPQNSQQTYGQQSRPQTQQSFDPIPMKYAELLPALLAKNLVQTRPPPTVPEKLPTWYRTDLTCAFHQGAPGHDVEHCFALKKEVQNLIRANILSFKDTSPNVQNNPLPNHGSTVNMIQHYPDATPILNACDIKTPLVPIHIKMCKAKIFEHNHADCEVCLINPRGCMQVQNDVQGLLDRGELIASRKVENVCVIVPEFNIPKKIEIPFDGKKSTVTPLVICLPGPVPYTSEKAIPYRYDATMIQNDQELPIPSLDSVINISDNSRILRSGRILPDAVQKKVDDMKADKSTAPAEEKKYEESDEMLKLIKRSEYKVVDQLLQTPSKISILSLLMSSEAHREALMKVLDQAYVDQDVTTGQFGNIVGNVTASNNLSFSDEELSDKGKNHNLALHISVLCKSDAISNVLVDTGSSLNVMAKNTLNKLTYQDSPLRASSLIVKAFDGSRKPVVGEIELPITIGPHTFQITFQVMNIQANYSCLLGRPWIHEAGAVTSTLHQKLKFVSNGKLIVVNGEETLLVSHLSAFPYIEADDADGTSFQGLSIEGTSSKKVESTMASLKDAQRAVRGGLDPSWGQLVQLPENKHREGLGFNPTSGKSKAVSAIGPIEHTFRSAGFTHSPSVVNAISEDNSDEVPAYVTPGGICCNWVTIDVPSVIPLSK